jgi:pimeloyl-ACP methyl ester carboxylesterase
MRTSSRDGIGIAYEVRGDGPPLLLLNHLGASRLGWRDEFLDDLSRSFTLVLPDHRGTGASDKPRSAWSIRDLAFDNLGVLDALGVSRAHLLGLSMGGAIAQELILCAPERVDRLILVGTFCGWPHAVRPEPSVMELLQPGSDRSLAEQIRRSLPAYYSPGFIRRNEDYLVALTMRATRDTPPATLLRHSEAVDSFDTYDRLPGVRQPTLVLHGVADAVIPSRNAEILVARLPHAVLRLMPDVGHIPTTEEPELTARLVREFCEPSRVA